MFKDNEITITARNITGNMKTTSTRVVNLSSCPKQFINVMLTRIPQMPDSVTYLPVTPNIMFSTVNNAVISKMKRTTILIVADSDDYLMDIKIYNLKKFSNYITIGRIIFSLEKSDGTALEKRGTMRTICNHHHRDKDIIALGCNNANIEDATQLLMVTIIKTQNCVVNSVAGLTVAMKYLKVPFMVEHRQVTIYKSWLWMKPTWKMTIDDLDKYNNTCMDPPSSKVHWTSLMGYTEYVTTEKGPKRIRDKIEDENWLNKILKQIKNLVLLLLKGDEQTYAKIKQTILQYFKRILDVFKGHNSDKTKTKNKNKNNKRKK